MTTQDTLVTKFVLQDGYSAQAAKATAATNAFASAQAKLGRKGAGGDLSDAFDSLSDSANKAIGALGPLQALIGGIFAVGVGAAVGGFALMKQAAEFDSLRQSLVAVEGDARKAGDALSRLKELAKAPGLGFEEAVRGYSGLRNAGLTQDFAEQIIKQFANANARGGGDKETFGRILTQIRQAAGRNFLAQEDLTPIGEAGIPINKLLKDTFGTGDTEELKKRGISAQAALQGIVASLSKLERVAGGAQNEFDNLDDAIKFASVSAGDALNQSLLPYVSEFATAVSNLTENGVIKSAFEGIAENVVAILADGGDNIEKALQNFVVSLQTASGGARNLAENAKGFWDFVKDAAPALIGPLYEPLANFLNDGTSLGDEQARNERTAEMQGDTGSKLQRNKKADEEIKRAGYTGDRNSWLRMSQSERDAWLKGKDGKGGASAAEESPVVKELKLVRAEIKRGNDMLEDAQSGGGGLVRNGIGAEQLSQVTGGYLKRFRRNPA